MRSLSKASSEIFTCLKLVSKTSMRPLRKLAARINFFPSISAMVAPL